MNEQIVNLPEACQTMIEVRAGVDALDRELVALLATRFGHMRAAARIKPSRDAVRDEARKASVIAAAVAGGGDPYPFHPDCLSEYKYPALPAISGGIFCG